MDRLIRSFWAAALLAVASPSHGQLPSTSGREEYYSNGQNPPGGPMYGNGQYGRDPQCGGTDRAYYNRLYKSQATVISIERMQRLYRATAGQIWIRCGACQDQAICWPRPGYDQLIAEGQPNAPAPTASASPWLFDQPVQAAETPIQAAAATIQRQWASNRPLKAGVSYAATQLYGQPLHAIRVRAPILIGYDPNGATLKSLVDGAGNPIIGGVTGTFSDYPHQPPGLGGPIVHNGQLVAPLPPLMGIAPIAPRSFLGFRANPATFFVTDVPAFSSVGDRAKNLGPFLANLHADQGIGGLARLLNHGVDVHVSEALGRQHFTAAQVSDQPNARAVAGVSADGRTLVLLVEQGNGNGASPSGAGDADMAKLLLGLGAYDGVMMDSGGSAQIYIRNIADADNHRNDARRLPTGILF